MNATDARANGRQPRQPGPVAESISEVVELGKREQRQHSPSERIARRITLLSGTMLFVAANAVWFTVWILLNTGVTGMEPFDPFPFTFLTMTVSLEAIFLSIFILITEIQQSREADRRAKFDLQVNMIAEREVTAVLKELRRVQEHLGMDTFSDGEAKDMEQHTRLDQLADETEAAEAADHAQHARGPV
jgi:uncharacterized membrane protein